MEGSNQEKYPYMLIKITKTVFHKTEESVLVPSIDFAQTWILNDYKNGVKFEMIGSVVTVYDKGALRNGKIHFWNSSFGGNQYDADFTYQLKSKDGSNIPFTLREIDFENVRKEAIKEHYESMQIDFEK